MGLVRSQHGTYAVAIMVEYPEFHWKYWEFTSVPATWFRTVVDSFARGDVVASVVVRQIVEDVAEKNSIQSIDEWNAFPAFKVKWQPIRGQKFMRLLHALYPDHKWGKEQSVPTWKGAAGTERSLKKLFPTEGTEQSFCSSHRSSSLFLEILKEQTVQSLGFEVPVGERNADSLRFDFVLPKLRLAIEHQGRQHLVQTPMSDHMGSARDALKQRLCSLNNFSLITVRYLLV